MDLRISFVKELKSKEMRVSVLLGYEPKTVGFDGYRSFLS
jgi:hypothetical protein